MLITPGVYEAWVALSAVPAIVPPVARIVILGFAPANVMTEKIRNRNAVEVKYALFIALNYKKIIQ